MLVDIPFLSFLVCLFICFSILLYRYGRVNYVLAKRLELLKEVQRLQVRKLKT